MDGSGEGNKRSQVGPPQTTHPPARNRFSRLLRFSTREATFEQRHIEARSRNNCCRRNAIRMIYFCVHARARVRR